MQFIWAVSKSYLQKHSRKETEYPTISHCPHCNRFINLWHHGYYERHVPTVDRVWNLDICRYICPHCHKTVSLLPWFLLPYFQYPRDTILHTLREHFLSQTSGIISRQLNQFYAKRFMGNLKAIILIFRDKGFYETLPENEKQKAIKLVEWLQDTCPSASIQMIDENCKHFHNFMAL